MVLSSCAQRAVNGWIVISTLLFLQCLGFSNASPIPNASPNLRQDEHKPQPYQDEHISKRNGNKEYEGRPVSNYDYYKPLDYPQKSRNTYLEEKEWVNPKDEDKKWLKNDGYKSESEEVEEKPVYGYKTEEYHGSKHKQMDEESPFNDNKNGYFSDWTYSKHNGWKSKAQDVPLKLQRERDFPLKLNQDTSKGKDLNYKSIDVYPIERKHPNKGTWKTQEDPHVLKDDSRGFKYERVQLPKHSNGPLVVRPNNERSATYSKNYESEKDWNEQKADLEKEAEKEIRGEKFNVRNKWLGDNDQYHKEPEPKHSLHGEKEGLFKDIEKPYSKSYPDYISKFNHGGHSYGLSYTPSKDMRHLIDGNRKATFLQEHEKKLEEMHKKHMESFEKFMDKPFLGSKRGYSSIKKQESEELYEKPKHDSKTRVYTVNPQNHEAEQEDHHVSLNKYGITDKTQINNLPSKTPFPYHLWN